MNRFVTHFLLLGAVVVLAFGCTGNTSSTGPADRPITLTAITSPFAGKKLCLACGEAFAKAKTHTCSADAARCDGCGRVKGSALCCVEINITDPNAKAICGSCGQIAGSETCCKAGAAKCAKCDLHKGAPACCKLAHDHDHEHKEGK
ncbi:MAG TPA: hypothetical protein QF761_07915 [Pirellulales bacterium]|nr:hypothetical protein [Pirellulales bacterium]